MVAAQHREARRHREWCENFRADVRWKISSTWFLERQTSDVLNEELLQFESIARERIEDNWRLNWQWLQRESSTLLNVVRLHDTMNDEAKSRAVIEHVLETFSRRELLFAQEHEQGCVISSEEWNAAGALAQLHGGMAAANRHFARRLRSALKIQVYWRCVKQRLRGWRATHRRLGEAIRRGREIRLSRLARDQVAASIQELQSQIDALEGGRGRGHVNM
jgi:hypothetical protein